MENLPKPEQIRKKLNRVWRGMIERCTYKKHKSYEFYGGRGIFVSSEWSSFEPFFKWSTENGYSPGMKLDRIDNNGPYAPWNCRFVDHKQQMNNTRANVLITAWGETKTISEWMDDKRCAVSGNKTIVRRMRDGMSAEEAISKPSNEDKFRFIRAFGEEKSLAEWSRDPRCTVPYSALLFRLDSNWPVEEAITSPSGDKIGKQRNAELVTAFGETKTYPEWSRDSRCAVKESCLRMRIQKYGFSPEEAITLKNRQRRI